LAGEPWTGRKEGFLGRNHHFMFILSEEPTLRERTKRPFGGRFGHGRNFGAAAPSRFVET